MSEFIIKVFMKENKLEICMDDSNVTMVVDKKDYVIDLVRFLLDFEFDALQNGGR